MTSPCVNICSLDEKRMCVGCGRTLGEIAEWGNAGPERQRTIVVAARGRLRGEA